MDVKISFNEDKLEVTAEWVKGDTEIVATGLQGLKEGEYGVGIESDEENFISENEMLRLEKASPLTLKFEDRGLGLQVASTLWGVDHDDCDPLYYGLKEMERHTQSRK